MKNYFTIAELSRSATAVAKGIKNVPPTVKEMDALMTLITECLNPIRERYGHPIRVTSGFRCEALNRAVGGVASSQHLKGEAADLQGATDDETARIFECARDLGVYDQLLFEHGKGKRWVHISHKASGDRHIINGNYEV